METKSYYLYNFKSPGMIIGFIVLLLGPFGMQAFLEYNDAGFEEYNWIYYVFFWGLGVGLALYGISKKIYITEQNIRVSGLTDSYEIKWKKVKTIGGMIERAGDNGSIEREFAPLSELSSSMFGGTPYLFVSTKEARQLTPYSLKKSYYTVCFHFRQEALDLIQEALKNVQEEKETGNSGR